MSAMAVEEEAVLAPVPSSSGQARRIVRDSLAGLNGGFIETAELVTSELVSNAVLYARTTIRLGICLDGDLLRIEVRDGSPALPQVKEYGLDATTGRGLRLVGTLSERWGTEVTAQGKAVWCELRLPSDPVDGNRRRHGASRSANQRRPASSGPASPDASSTRPA